MTRANPASGACVVSDQCALSRLEALVASSSRPARHFVTLRGVVRGQVWTRPARRSQLAGDRMSQPVRRPMVGGKPPPTWAKSGVFCGNSPMVSARSCLHAAGHGHGSSSCTGTSRAAQGARVAAWTDLPGHRRLPRATQALCAIRLRVRGGPRACIAGGRWRCESAGVGVDAGSLARSTGAWRNALAAGRPADQLSGGPCLQCGRWRKRPGLVWCVS